MNNKFSTLHFKSIKYNVEALQLVLDANKELIKNKLVDTDYGHEIRTDDEAIILLCRGKYVGICTFYNYDESYWISMSYVAPKHRKKGGWLQLRQHVNNIAREEGIRNIISGVHKCNYASIEANEKIGSEIIIFFKQKVI